jgi:anthranilate synthase component 1
VGFFLEEKMELRRFDNRMVGWEELPLDLVTPVSAYLRLRKKGAVFLLESVEKGEKLGRYSFIGIDPEEKIVVDGNSLRTGGREIAINRDNIKTILDSILKERCYQTPEELAFAGGWAGYISYEFVRFFDEINFKKQRSLFPQLYLFKVNKLLVFDHVKHIGKILVGGNELTEEDIEETIASIKLALTSGRSLGNKRRESSRYFDSSLSSSLSEEEFINRVIEAKNFIKAGDIFQVVLSIKFKGRTSAAPFNIYRALRILNPSPYMFYFDFGEFQIIGSSPESHVKVEKDTVSIRPIAGTRRRGKTKEEDFQLEQQLINDQKERAEHIMLIDLARNDLGKICLPGSIQISEKMSIEKYSHVMHIVSQVEGKLSPNKTFFDILQATFPAGTVTGAPKLRAMEIIDQLEPVERGPYGGVVGYFAFNGNVDLCIGIRMIIYKKRGFFLQGGAGIVYGSKPQNEYYEIQNKIKGMYEAIKLAEEGGF